MITTVSQNMFNFRIIKLQFLIDTFDPHYKCMCTPKHGMSMTYNCTSNQFLTTAPKGM
jgi:hypothetical protein